MAPDTMLDDPELRETLTTLGGIRTELERQRQALDTLICAAVVDARDAGATLDEIAELLKVSKPSVAKAEKRGRKLGIEGMCGLTNPMN